MPTRYVYTGDGTQMLAGVGTRNLTQADYDALTDEQKKAVQQSPLYRPAKGDETKLAEEEDPAAPAPGGGRIVRLPFEGYMAPSYAAEALEKAKSRAVRTTDAGAKKAGE